MKQLLKRLRSNKTVMLLVVVGILLILAGTGWMWQQHMASDGRRECPDRWYANRMPQATPEGEQPETGTQRQYFVIDGERVEYQDMDVEWVKNNCSVDQPTPVY
ncbi:hypothetical protein BRC19_02515 [Candidatus Saccharibacteria bacterium QS_5_54_17]|nr:MAG: hypothetical protein BRC19_02515 [Candidatus Saccharibacteria bacterium QS_5_54_17]